MKKRGLKSEGTGIENRFGYRNAVVETSDGKRWFISDQTYCAPYFNNGPVPDTKRDKNGPFPFGIQV